MFKKIYFFIYYTQIELWNREGQAVHKYTHSNLSSVCSTIAVHPYREAVAGGNSSGKVHILGQFN